nr:uncharacterized protein LOC113725762 isoform X4 [Coffea arabica]
MASRLITTHRSFCYKVELNSCRLSFPSSNPHVNFCIPAFVSCRGPFTCLKLNHCLKLRASSEGLPSELVDEDSKFVPLNAEDPRYGPPIQQLLKELDGDFLEVIFCTEDMITCCLWEAMNTKQPNLDAAKIKRMIVADVK